MKLKIIAALVAITQTLCWQAGAQISNTNKVAPTRTPQTALPHTWTFQQGGKMEAWFVGFHGTNQVIVRKAADAKNYSLTISTLSSDDQTYLAKLRDATLKAQLDAEAKQLEKQGQLELTVDLMENFPEKVKEAKESWMDAEFVEIDGGNLLRLTKAQESQDRVLSRIAGQDFNTTDWRDGFLGFRVVDKNGKSYAYCYASKKLPIGDAIAKLKRGDGIRLKGAVSSMDAFGADKHDLWFFVTDVRLVKLAAKQ